jgi:iron uptake system EfeUOB component EfeO/EfeM
MPANRLKLILIGAIGALVVIVVALGVVFVSLRSASKPAGNAVSIEVSDTACTPNDVSVAAGTPDFSIRNTGTRAIEWEILNGVMVLAERENIAPGFTVEITPRLEPGSYQMTCGLLSNPRGKLTVVAADGSTTALPAAPTLTDLVAPTAEYRVYAIQSADQLTAAATATAAALKAGDLASARTHAADAVAAFGHLAPVLHLFEQDAAPLSSGPASIAGLKTALDAIGTPASLAGVADGLAHNAATLGTTIHSHTPAPREIIAGAATVVADLGKGIGDRAEAAARIAGVRKVVELFRPLTRRADKALAAKLDNDLAAAEAALTAAGTPPAQSAQLADLGADLTDLQSALGLNAS